MLPLVIFSAKRYTLEKQIFSRSIDIEIINSVCYNDMVGSLFL